MEQMASTYPNSAVISTLNGAGAPPPMATLCQTLFRGICPIIIAVSLIIFSSLIIKSSMHNTISLLIISPSNSIGKLQGVGDLGV